MARRNRALILLAFALASGVLAAMLALRYLRQQSRPLSAAEPARSTVVVAARALPVGSIIAEPLVEHGVAPEAREVLVSLTPLKREAKPAEVAYGVVFLARTRRRT